MRPIAESLEVVGFRLRLIPFREESDYYRALLQHIEAWPHEEGAFFVFPGLFPMGLLPEEFKLQAEGLGDQLLAHGRGLKEVYHEVGQRAARTAGVYLAPGSVLLPVDSERVEHYAAVFSPEGEMVGSQVQTHPSRSGAVLRLGEEINVISVGPFKTALVLGADAYQPEVSRIATLLGAEMLIAPRAPLSQYSSERAMTGMWQEVQQNQVYGVETGLFGPVFDRMADGKLALMGPCDGTPEETGFYARPGYFVAEGALTHRFDREELKAVRQRYPLFRHLNPALYRRYFPGLYRKGIYS